MSLEDTSSLLDMECRGYARLCVCLRDRPQKVRTWIFAKINRPSDARGKIYMDMAPNYEYVQSANIDRERTMTG